MILVVSDTSPIRALSHLGLLDLLERLFGKVLVPPEVERGPREPRGDLPSIDVRILAHFEVVAPRGPVPVEKLGSLDPGESQAITLALEVKAEAILIDEAAGRAKAKELGLRPLGVLGILLRAKQRGLIGPIRSLLDRLEEELGFFLSSELREGTLREAGE